MAWKNTPLEDIECTELEAQEIIRAVQCGLTYVSESVTQGGHLLLVNGEDRQSYAIEFRNFEVGQENKSRLRTTVYTPELSDDMTGKSVGRVRTLIAIGRGNYSKSVGAGAKI